MEAVCLVIGSGLTQFYESCMSGYWQWINSVLCILAGTFVGNSIQSTVQVRSSTKCCQQNEKPLRKHRCMSVTFVISL